MSPEFVLDFRRVRVAWGFMMCVLSSAVSAQPQPIEPFNPVEMERFNVPAAWEKYGDRLSWGKGQTLAILDDGFDLGDPVWQAQMPWGPKVVTAWDAVDGDDDPSFGPNGYHGTTVGYPSSQWHDGKAGVAYRNQVALVRATERVHLRSDETRSIAEALQWVIDHHEPYHITAVNLACLDDQRHTQPMPTVIDAKLAELRRLDIWVSAPCGNNQFTDGISWPACQPGVSAIGSTNPYDGTLRNDRFTNTDLVVPSVATSSGNAYAAGSAMVLREAIGVAEYDWSSDGDTLSEAVLAIFQRTGVEVTDDATGRSYRQLDLLAALDVVFANGSTPRISDENIHP